MEPNIHLGEQTTSYDLPNQSQNQMFTALGKIGRPDVDDRASNSFRRRDDDVVILGYLECIERPLSGRLIKNTNVDRVRDRVVDKFTENETVLAFIEELHRFCRDRVPIANIWVVFKDL